MHGVVSLLDDEHTSQVESIWSEMRAALGIEKVCQTPFPHFSYHVSAEYNVDELIPVLDQLAQKTTAFIVRTAGLAFFTGSAPVLYIPIVRPNALTQTHESVFSAVEGTGAQALAYYTPEIWMPHVTLADGAPVRNGMPRLLELLGDRPFQWQVPINNFAIIYDSGSHQHLVHKATFKRV